MSQITLHPCTNTQAGCDVSHDLLFDVELNRGVHQRCIIDRDLLCSVLGHQSHRDRLGEASIQRALQESSQAVLTAVAEAMRHSPPADGLLRLERQHFAVVDADIAPSL